MKTFVSGVTGETREHGWFSFLVWESSLFTRKGGGQNDRPWAQLLVALTAHGNTDLVNSKLVY